MSSPVRRLPRVLITNDDGPPTDMSGASPFVCVPDGQRSWVANSYLIAQTTTGKYFYPKGPNGTEGEWTDLPRPLKAGEDAGEWIALSGTPATCSNVMLHSLFPPGTFDILISGPNLGRNTGTAFAMSSGTIGAAMSAAISGTPAIALSWGLMQHYKPPSQEIRDAATRVSVDIIKRLWEIGFGEGADKVDVYSVNIPLMPAITVQGGPEIQWTAMARNKYGRLFKSISEAPQQAPAKDEGGPAAIPQDEDETHVLPREDESSELRMHDEHFEKPLSFVFSPDIGGLINPTPSSVQEGTDTHAILDGVVSITPLFTAFAEAPRRRERQRVEAESSRDREEGKQPQPKLWGDRYDYPPVTPLADLNLLEIPPRPYRPFRHASYPINMGIRPMEPNNWIELDREFVLTFAKQLGTVDERQQLTRIPSQV
ncbi:hypothetical protein OIO90_000816 [Microbotryomycetes sp. JL221]|nr:hypothetical protein OIO90_000816 [Microbotryomycetes sp. JL221]